MDNLPLIVGISGASGAIYGIRLLQVLRGKIPTHLIVSRSAALTLKKEVDLSIEQVRALAQTNYQIGDVGAAISSGSFKTRGMMIAPCSIRTLSDIAYGTTDTLLSRAADVTLKGGVSFLLSAKRRFMPAISAACSPPPKTAPSLFRRCRPSITSPSPSMTSSIRQSGGAWICLISMLALSSAGKAVEPCVAGSIWSGNQLSCQPLGGGRSTVGAAMYVRLESDFGPARSVAMFLF